MPELFHIKNTDTEIRVWYLSEDIDFLRNNSLLNDNEETKLAFIKNENARKSFLGLRILKKNMGCGEISYLESGKPVLESGYISMTHSGSWVGMLYSKKSEVGIDIEGIHPRILKIKDRFLSTDEQTQVCRDDLFRFTLCWSAKEAVFKKYGNETVFFKENQKVVEIDETNKKIRLELVCGNNKFNQELFYILADEKTVLVYTL